MKYFYLTYTSYYIKSRCAMECCAFWSGQEASQILTEKAFNENRSKG